MNDNIIIKENNNVRYLQFKKLLEYPNIRHCYTLKSLNFKGTSGEKQKSIEKICIFGICVCNYT